MGHHQKKLIFLVSKLLGVFLLLLLWACSGGALGSGDEGGGALDTVGHGGAEGQATPTHSEGTVDPKWDGNPGMDSKKNKVDNNGGSPNDSDSEDNDFEPSIIAPPGGRPPFPGEPGYLGIGQNNGSTPAKIKMPSKI